MSTSASQDAALLIREFTAGDEADFQRLNREWIVRHFDALEPKDAAMINDPRSFILDRGGRIFLAVRHGETVGCCALLAMGPGEFEVAKMAVTESCQRAGIGRRLLEAVVREARASGATRLYLETNHTLTPAIRLYESQGFRHLPPERIVPSVYARADVYMELGTVGGQWGRGQWGDSGDGDSGDSLTRLLRNSRASYYHADTEPISSARDHRPFVFTASESSADPEIGEGTERSVPVPRFHTLRGAPRGNAGAINSGHRA